MNKLTQFKGTVLEDGYGVVGKKVMKDKTLHYISKAIYAYLCTYGNGGYPSRDLITSDLGINKSTYTKYVGELKERGYIKITQARMVGEFNHNIYSIEQTTCTVSPCTVSRDTVEVDTNSTILNSTSINKKDIYTADFEKFWAAYPNGGYQDSKIQSAKNFSTLLKKKNKAEDIIQAAKNYALDCKSKEKTDCFFKASNFVGQKGYFESYLPGVWDSTDSDESEESWDENGIRTVRR